MRIINQNVSGGVFFASCIATVVKNETFHSETGPEKLFSCDRGPRMSITEKIGPVSGQKNFVFDYWTLRD